MAALLAAHCLSGRCLFPIRKGRKLFESASRFMVNTAAFNPHEILGIAKNASKQEVKAAYRRAALRTHPDRENGSVEAFRLAAQAFQVLSNPLWMLMNQTSHQYPARRKTNTNMNQWQFHSVSNEEADRLFRDAFGGRTVKEVMHDEALREGEGVIVDHGVHSACMRQARFNRLLMQARESAMGSASAKTTTSAKTSGETDAGTMNSGGSVRTKTTREVMRNTISSARGVDRFVRVTTTTSWPGGRTEQKIVDKPIYRM